MDSRRVALTTEASDASALEPPVYVELNLQQPEVELLREILDETLRDLKYELADTDNPTYKQRLRNRETILRSVLDRLNQDKAPCQ